MPKRRVEPIAGGRVRLRLLEERDLPMTLAWRNRDDVRPWFFTSSVIAPEEHRAWFERYRERDDDFVFVIEETAAGGRPIGQAALYDVDIPAGRAEFGRLLIGDPDARGRGLAREATALLVAEAFERWGLRELRLQLYAANARARRLYEACGFHAVGQAGELVSMTCTRRSV